MVRYLVPIYLCPPSPWLCARPFVPPFVCPLLCPPFERKKKGKSPSLSSPWMSPICDPFQDYLILSNTIGPGVPVPLCVSFTGCS